MKRPIGLNRTKPNVVVIFADDLGYGGVGVQGCSDVPTPHVDSIAANGIRFTDGYVSAPVCSPSRAGLMTGRYQQRFGHELNPGSRTAQADPKFGLPVTETTFPERMKALGYRTGMVGKWHLGFRPEYLPTRRGFDEFFGFLAGLHNYMGVRDEPDNPILRGTEPAAEKEYLTDAFAREAVSFIEKHRNEPFFLYLAFNAVHAPMEAFEKYLSRFQHISDPKRRTHAAMLSAMDDGIGRVLEALRNLGLEEDTLVFFLSDNGGPTRSTTSSNAPLRGYKFQVLEGGIRIPFMIRWKGKLPAGKIYSHPVISLDILPTAVAAAGGTVSRDWKLDGVNLLPYLDGAVSNPPHDILYWRYGEQWAVRKDGWKLLVDDKSPDMQLYHLPDDVGENNNLVGKEKEKVSELKAVYEAWNAGLAKPRWKREAGGGR